MVGFTILAVLASSVAVTSAHMGCGGHDVARRNPGGPMKTFARRQTSQAAPTDVASGSASTDVDYECTGYSYQPVLDIKPKFPTIWETADIQPGDTAAQNLFATINATVNSKLPNVKPKGTASGDFSQVGYNAADPDCWWTWRQCTTPAADSGVPADWTHTPEPNTWGFGFDDGPNCSHNALYDYLAEQKQKASMFYIGSNVMNWPLQALRGIEDGHEICVHTWSHQYMTSFSNEVAFAELYYTQQAIKELLGVTPTCWRPPFGDVDNRIRLIAAGLNLTTIVWSDDSEDWRINTNGVTAADIDANYQALIDSAKNGTYATKGPIVLNHELNNYTMGEMIKYYPQIKAAFKAVVPVGVAFNVTHPYAEGNITGPTFEQYTAGSINPSTGPVSASASSTASSGASATSGSGVSASRSGTAASAAVASPSKTGAASSNSAQSALLGGLVAAIVVAAAAL